MALWYAGFIRRFAKEERKAIEEEFKTEAKTKSDASDLVDTALNLLVSKATRPPSEAAPTQESAQLVRRARDVIDAKISESDSELAVLRAVASTGPLMFAFAHEVKGVVGLLDTGAGELELVASRLPKSDRNSIRNISKSLREASYRFSQLARLFGIFTTAQKLTKRRVPVRAAVTQIVEGFGFILDEFKIEVDVKTLSDSIKSPSMIEAEFYSIVVNLLSNAIKASIARASNHIRISAEQNGTLVLRVLDKGVGLSKDRWKDVFEPLNPDPEDRIYKHLSTRLGDEELATLGRGTGLGLSIVRGIAESHKGTAQFVVPPKGWSTCVQVTLS
jgi:signal transduction histidine kinase